MCAGNPVNCLFVGFSYIIDGGVAFPKIIVILQEEALRNDS
jgi:hypothetical protein